MDINDVVKCAVKLSSMNILSKEEAEKTVRSIIDTCETTRMNCFHFMNTIKSSPRFQTAQMPT